VLRDLGAGESLGGDLDRHCGGGHSLEKVNKSGGITRNGQKEDSVTGNHRAGDHDRFILDAGSSPEQGSRGLSPARRPDFGGLLRLAPRVPRLAEGSGNLGGLECGELHQP
jgi:hypothetical protein